MNKIFCAMIAVAFAACFDPGTATDEAVVSTTEQGLSTCWSSCDPPNYNGVPVSCTSNIYCISAPEAAYCLQDDGSYLAADCAPAPPCGDGVCEGNEAQTCPGDCNYCGDGICRYN